MFAKYKWVMMAAIGALVLAVAVPLMAKPAAAHPSYGGNCASCHGSKSTPTPTPPPAPTPVPTPPPATPTPTPPVGSPSPTATPISTPSPVASPTAPDTTQPLAPVATHIPSARVEAPAVADPNHAYFAETGHFLSSGFLALWREHGGLMVFGYPITEEFTENGMTVQYFERARFEYHPEFRGTPYEVQLGLLGRQVTTDMHGSAFVPPYGLMAPNNTSDVRFFAPESGFALAHGFKSFWESNGGLAVFGLPISNEFDEVNPEDGKTYTVQYFERARFEYHPENKGTQNEVQLGLLGKQILSAN